MRHEGQITHWKDERGFGFITPRGGGERVFVHIRAFSNAQRRPLGDELVTYELGTDEMGRDRAERVAFVGERPAMLTPSRTAALALPAVFLIFVAGSTFVGQLHFAVLGLHLIASLFTFLVYASDKSAAQAGEWRFSEGRLHALALIGGWPGALVAQEFLRHKSKKLSFRIAFWITVVLNCLGLWCLLSLGRSDSIRRVFEQSND